MIFRALQSAKRFASSVDIGGDRTGEVGGAGDIAGAVVEVEVCKGGDLEEFLIEEPSTLTFFCCRTLALSCEADVADIRKQGLGVKTQKKNKALFCSCISFHLMRFKTLNTPQGD